QRCMFQRADERIDGLPNNSGLLKFFNEVTGQPGLLPHTEPCHAVVESHVIPSAFIAAVIGSEKTTGSTRSTMSPDTSRKFRLFSRGISARRAPLSIATCNGSANERIDLMFPWMLRSPRMTRPA